MTDGLGHRSGGTLGTFGGKVITEGMSGPLVTRPSFQNETTQG